MTGQNAPANVPPVEVPAAPDEVEVVFLGASQGVKLGERRKVAADKAESLVARRLARYSE